MIKLHSILGTDVPNLIEIYITKHNSDDKSVIDIRTNDAVINTLQRIYKNFKTTRYISYNRNELNYLYDLTDDHQYVYSKLRENDCVIPAGQYKMYMISYKLSKLPTHLFPCLNDIDDIVEYTISEFKLTNRLSIMIRKDNYGQYAYIEYTHSSQIDIDKIETSINNVIKNVMNI